MPYIDGKRVSQAEWIDRFSTLRQFHTGPNGANPAEPAPIDEETMAPVVEVKSKDGRKRSARSATAAKKAIADAIGVKDNSPVLADIDVSGVTTEEDE